MKKIISALVVVLFIIIIIFLATKQPVTAEVYIPSEKEEAIILTKIEDYKQRMDDAHSIAELARKLGYNDDHIIIQTAKKEWEESNSYKNYYEDFYNTKFKEYPVASIVWLYLKDLGYNDYVCAGIIGNMMVESGHLTLELVYNIRGGATKEYYGLCQWLVCYNSEIDNLDILGQLDYLANNIEYEFDTFGYFYYNDFDFDQFLLINDLYEATLSFAQSYERCASFSYPHRYDCALIAYDYFAN